MLETASGRVRSSRNSVLGKPDAWGHPRGGTERQNIAIAEFVTTAGRNATPFDVCQLWLGPSGPKPPRLLSLRRRWPTPSQPEAATAIPRTARISSRGVRPETSKMYRCAQWDLVHIRGVRSHCH